MEDVVDGAVALRGRGRGRGEVGVCGEVNELDDALGGIVDGEPRDLFVQFGKDTDRVCTLSYGVANNRRVRRKIVWAGTRLSD